MMGRNVILWTLFAAVAVHSPLRAQYFTLRSSEGKKVRVHLEELRRELRVSCLRDSLLFYEYFGGCHARMLGPGFLQITYSVRGGSDFARENTAILAVRNGRLCQTLLLNSSFDAVALNYHHTSTMDLKLSAGKGNEYLLTATVQEYLKDGGHPAGLLRKYRPYVFHFNKELMAFYSNTVVAARRFKAAEVNQGKEYMQFEAGDTLTEVLLTRDRYYYADGSWYGVLSNKFYGQQGDSVIENVFGLAIVQRKNAWVDSVSRRRHGVSLMMLETAGWPSDSGRYVLQAGYRSKQGFEPYFLFKVYQPDLVIRTEELSR